MKFLIAILLAVFTALPGAFSAIPVQACEGIVSCTCSVDPGNPASDKKVDFDGKTTEQMTQICNDFCANKEGAEETTSFTLTCDGATLSTGRVLVPEGQPDIAYNPPNLSIQIPGLNKFEPTRREGEYVVTTYLAQYVNALIGLIITFAALLSVIMMMVAGLSWMTARGNAAQAKTAQKLMGKSIFSILLVLFIVVIARLIDPSTTEFLALKVLHIDQRIHESFDPNEGPGGGKADPIRCAEAIKKAKDQSACSYGVDFLISSPTGSPYECNYHFTRKSVGGDTDDVNYDFKQVTALDFHGSWDSEILAPFDGTVNYVEEHSATCGNLIELQSANGATISLCHVKDFFGGDGEYKPGRTVKKGDVIGHLGGRCSAKETPKDKTMLEKGWCNYGSADSGVDDVCTSPTIRENCEAQKVMQSGRTSGPHVHMTWKGTGYLLSCLEE